MTVLYLKLTHCQPGVCLAPEPLPYRFSQKRHFSQKRFPNGEQFDI
jgi:hypothetical protein